jgi:hypothetical protein
MLSHDARQSTFASFSPSTGRPESFILRTRLTTYWRLGIFSGMVNHLIGRDPSAPGMVIERDYEQ